MERTHLLHLAIPLIPFWETKLASLPAGPKKLVSDIIQRTVEQRPSKKLFEKIKRNVYSSLRPDWDLLASLAVSECLQSESFQDFQRDHRISADLISSSWGFLIADIEGKLGQVSELESFARVVRKLLIALIKERPNITIDILSLSLMEKVTESLTEGLTVAGSVQPSLECLEVMLASCLLLPPHSSLSPLHQSWAALLAQPWLPHLSPSLQSDLRIPASLRRSLANSPDSCSWKSEERNKALRLLSFLPPNICPRFRLSVLKEAWRQQALGVIESLPALIGLSPSAGDLARDVIRDITEKDQTVGVVLSLATVASSYLCSLARRTVPWLVSPAAGQLDLRLRCLDCSPLSEEDSSSSTAATTLVASTELESLMRLVGHLDSRVRLAMVRLIPPAAAHCLLSQQAASLWMNSVSDPDLETRTTFANNVGLILRCGGRLSFNKPSVTGFFSVEGETLCLRIWIRLL